MLSFETLAFAARIGVGALAFAAFILVIWAALRLVTSQHVRLLLRSASSMGSFLEEDEDKDGRPTVATSVVYCRTDGRAQLTAPRRLPRH